MESATMKITRIQKSTGVVLAMILSLAMLTACEIPDTPPEVVVPRIQEEPQEDIDRLGSWSHIRQTVERAENWQQIVTESSFQLDEKTPHITPSNGEISSKNYDIGYGSYPNIDGSTVAMPLALEFARQHLGFSDAVANSFVHFSTTH
jgi:phosphate transport system substrate-binding protein